jgi:hypothetical protein
MTDDIPADVQPPEAEINPDPWPGEPGEPRDDWPPY